MSQLYNWIDLLPALMFIALGFLIFSGYPVAFILAGLAIFFGVLGWLLDVFYLVEFFNFLPRFWGQVATNLTLVAIPCFIFMGNILAQSNIARNLLHILEVLLRRAPGGLALSVTMMGTIVAATTGIIGVSVVMITLLALPTMLARGYDKGLATGAIAGSSALGMLIPPSIMLVVFADMLSVSVGNLFLAALFPGLLLSLIFLTYIAVRSAMNVSLAPPMPKEETPYSWWVLCGLFFQGFVPPFVLVGLVLGSIVTGFATPTEAAGVGAAGALIIAWIGKSLNRQILSDIVQRTGKTVGMIFFIVIGATMFAYVFRSLGGETLIIDAIASTGLGPWGLLFLLMAVVFVLGFFLDWLEIALVLLPVFAPIIRVMDFGGHVAQAEIIYWFAVLLAMNLQTSFLTPPFGFALFYMKGVAPPEVRLQDIYRGIVPFVILQLLGLAIIITFPDVALWLPRVMLN